MAYSFGLFNSLQILAPQLTQMTTLTINANDNLVEFSAPSLLSMSGVSISGSGKGLINVTTGLSTSIENMNITLKDKSKLDWTHEIHVNEILEVTTSGEVSKCCSVQKVLSSGTMVYCCLFPRLALTGTCQKQRS